MNKKKKILLNKVLLWVLVIALICTIYILSDQEGKVSHRLSRTVDKAVTSFGLVKFIKNLGVRLSVDSETVLRKGAHFFLFFLLAVLLYLAINLYTRKFAKVITTAACIFFACMDEYHQMFISGRGARVRDIVIDTAGFVSALLLILAFEWYKIRRTKKLEIQQKKIDTAG